MSLVLNIVKGINKIKTLEVTRLILNFTTLPPEKNELLIRFIWDTLNERKDFVGAYIKKIVYIVGDKEKFKERLNKFIRYYRLPIKIQEDVVNLNVEQDYEIIKIILRNIFDKFLERKGMCIIRWKPRIAIPSDFSISPIYKDYLKAKFVEGFTYDLHYNVDGSYTLRLDPKLVALGDFAPIPGRRPLDIGKRKYFILRRKELEVLGLLGVFLKYGKLDTGTSHPSSLRYSHTKTFLSFLNITKIEEFGVKLQFEDEFRSIDTEALKIEEVTVKFRGDKRSIYPYMLINDEYLPIFSPVDKLSFLTLNASSLSEGKILEFLKKLKDRGEKLSKIYWEYNIKNVKPEFIKSQIDLERDSYDVFFIIIPDSRPDIYSEIKTISLSNSLPTQCILESIVKRIIEKEDSFSISNVALNIFVKAGGIPWVISDEYFKREYSYVGLTFKKKYLYGSNGRFFVSFADLFASDMEHVDVKVNSHTLPEDKKSLVISNKDIQKILNDVMGRYKTYLNTFPQKVLILQSIQIFPEETEGLIECLNKNYKDFVKEIIVIHFSKNNLFRGYDLDRQDKIITKNIWIKLEPQRLLVFFTGILNERYGGKCTPKPVILNIERIVNNNGKFDKSDKFTDEDLMKILLLILSMIKLRWNSFNLTNSKSPLPLYSSEKFGRLCVRTGNYNMTYKKVNEIL